MMKKEQEWVNSFNGCRTRDELRDYLIRDAQKYETMTSGLVRKILYIIASSPISCQHNLWKYVKCLRYCEYYYCNSIITKSPSLLSLYFSVLYVMKIYQLRKLSYKLGIQIPPGVFAKGLQIFHYGSIIVNEDARVGEDAIIYSGVVIGAKNNGVPIIGDRCFIGAGAKILGSVKIGNDVVIAPNAVVTHDVPDGAIVAGIPAKIIKYNKIYAEDSSN